MGFLYKKALVPQVQSKEMYAVFGQYGCFNHFVRLGDRLNWQYHGTDLTAARTMSWADVLINWDGNVGF